MARQSPFPGMDPYLERHWRDVHADFIALSRTALNSALPNDLVARMEERVVIDRVDYGRPRAIYPDVRVYEDRGGAAPGGATQGTAVIPEPIVLEFDIEEHSETYIQILDVDGGELITVVEFLSPTNKLPGAGRDDYRKKRDELVAAKVNVVEVDLVRAGPWRELLRPTVAPADVRTAYRVITRRFHPIQRVELYPMSIRQPLPTIPIPLRDGDRDVTLGLQSLIEQAYRNGRYDHTDYTQACDPPLEEEDAAWADGLLREAGVRKV